MEILAGERQRTMNCVTMEINKQHSVGSQWMCIQYVELNTEQIESAYYSTHVQRALSELPGQWNAQNNSLADSSRCSHAWLVCTCMTVDITVWHPPLDR